MLGPCGLNPGIHWFSDPGDDDDDDGDDDVAKYARLAGSALRAGYTLSSLSLVAFLLGVSKYGDSENGIW